MDLAPIAPTATQRDVLLQQLLGRNRAQQDPFHDLITSHTKLQAQFQAERQRAQALEQDLSGAQSVNRALSKDLATLREAVSSGAALGAKVAQLEERLSALQADNQLAYKEKASLVQEQVALTQQIRALQEKIQEKDRETELLRSTVSEKERDRHIAETYARETGVVNEVLKGELQALQVELVRQEEEIKKTEKENESLIQRLLALKHIQVEMMNMEVEKPKQQPQHKEETKETKEAKETEKRRKSDVPQFVYAQPPHTLKRPLMNSHMADVNVVKFNETGSVFVSGSNDTTVKLWDTVSGTCRATMTGSVQGVLCVDVSHNEQLVLGGSNDNGVRLWSVDNGKLKTTLTGHLGKVQGALFTSDSQRVVSGSHDRSIKIWDLSRGFCSKTIIAFSSVNDMALNGPATLAFSGHFDNHVRLWDLRTGDLCHDMDEGHSAQVTSVSLSTDNNTLLTNCRDNVLRLIDVRMWNVLSEFKDQAFRINSNSIRACLSPDTAHVASGGMDGRIFVWNVHSRKVVSVLQSHKSAVTCVDWHPQGGLFVSCEKDKAIMLWQ